MGREESGNFVNKKQLTNLTDLHALKMGDVLEWTWDENGIALNGGQGIVLEDRHQLVEKMAYTIRLVNILELFYHVSRCYLIANIFEDRDFKLQVDKRVKKDMDGNSIVIDGIVQLE